MQSGERRRAKRQQLEEQLRLLDEEESRAARTASSSFPTLNTPLSSSAYGHQWTSTASSGSHIASSSHARPRYSEPSPSAPIQTSGWSENPYQNYPPPPPARYAILPLFPGASATIASPSRSGGAIAAPSFTSTSIQTSRNDYYGNGNVHGSRQIYNPDQSLSLSPASVSPQLFSNPQIPAPTSIDSRSIPLPSRDQVNDYFISHMDQTRGMSTGWRLDNKLFDVYVLFGAVVRAGGSTKVTSMDWWPLIAAFLGLPSHEAPDGRRSSDSIGRQLQTSFLEMLGGLEILWERRKVADDAPIQPLPTPSTTAHYHQSASSSTARPRGQGHGQGHRRFAQMAETVSPDIPSTSVAAGPSWATAPPTSSSTNRPPHNTAPTSTNTRQPNFQRPPSSTSSTNQLSSVAARPVSHVSSAIPLRQPTPSHPSAQRIPERLGMQVESAERGSITSSRPVASPSTVLKPSAFGNASTSKQSVAGNTSTSAIRNTNSASITNDPTVQLQFHGRNIGEYAVPKVTTFMELVNSNVLPLPQVDESLVGKAKPDSEVWVNYARRCHELGNSVRQLTQGEPLRVVSAEEVVFWSKLLAIMKRNPSVIPPPVDEYRPRGDARSAFSARAPIEGSTGIGASQNGFSSAGPCTAQNSSNQSTITDPAVSFSQKKRGRPRRTIDTGDLSDIPPANSCPEGAPGSFTNPLTIVPSMLHRKPPATGAPPASNGTVAPAYGTAPTSQSNGGEFLSAGPASDGPVGNSDAIDNGGKVPKKRGRPKGSKTKAKPLLDEPGLSNTSVQAEQLPTPSTAVVSNGQPFAGSLHDTLASAASTVPVGAQAVAGALTANSQESGQALKSITISATSNGVKDPSTKAVQNTSNGLIGQPNIPTPTSPRTATFHTNAAASGSGSSTVPSSGDGSRPVPSKGATAGRARWEKWRERRAIELANRPQDSPNNDSPFISGSPNVERRKGGFGVPGSAVTAAHKRWQKQKKPRPVSASPSIARARIPFTPDLSPRKRIDLSGRNKSIAHLGRFDNTPTRFVPKPIGPKPIISLSQPSPLTLSHVIASSYHEPASSSQPLPLPLPLPIQESVDQTQISQDQTPAIIEDHNNIESPDHEYFALSQAIIDSVQNSRQRSDPPLTLNGAIEREDDFIVIEPPPDVPQKTVVTPVKRRPAPVIELLSAKRPKPATELELEPASKLKTVRLPVDRMKIVLPIRKGTREDLIRRGHYNAFRDDDSEDENGPKRKANLKLRPTKITLPSARSARPKEPEDIPVRFLIRPGPGLLEPYASILTEHSLLNRCIEHRCGWKGCNAILGSENQLKKHVMNRNHATQGKFQASIDRWVFKRGQTVVTEDVPGSWLYRCHWEGCEEPCFHTETQLSQHLTARHISRVLCCPYQDCDLTSPTISHLTRHVLKTHDLPTDLPRPLANLSIRLAPPSLKYLPPLPEFARTDELTTNLVLGSIHRSSFKQTWTRDKVLSHCFAGPDPIIHVEHPPHMLQRIEGSEEVELANDVLGLSEIIDASKRIRRKWEMVVKIPKSRSFKRSEFDRLQREKLKGNEKEAEVQVEQEQEQEQPEQLTGQPEADEAAKDVRQEFNESEGRIQLDQDQEMPVTEQDQSVLAEPEVLGQLEQVEVGESIQEAAQHQTHDQEASSNTITEKQVSPLPHQGQVGLFLADYESQDEQDQEGEGEEPSREVSLELPVDFSAPTPWPTRLDSPETDVDPVSIPVQDEDENDSVLVGDEDVQMGVMREDLQKEVEENVSLLPS